MPEKNEAWLEMWRRWQEMQAGMFREWMSAWTRLAASGKPGGEEGAETAGAAMDFYSRWLDYAREMMAKFSIPAQGIGPETLLKMFQSADVYSQLYAMWVELSEAYRKAVGEGGEQDFKAVSEVLEKWAEEYRGMVRKVFAPALPEQLQWIAELYSGEMPLLFSGLAMRLWAPWYEYGRRMAEMGIRPGRPSPEQAVEIYEGWRKAYEESFGRLLRAPALGYYREAAEKLKHTVDSLTEFNIVLTEFYAELESAGASSFQKLQEKLASMLAAGKAEPMSFRDLYRLWWETSEELYIELFRTEEFSKLQGRLVESGMQFRRDFQSFVEEITKELPFPNRSEMDHLYKTVDRLKREVRALKREVAELEGGAKESGGGG